MATQNATPQIATAEVFTPCGIIAGIVYSVSRGFRAETITVQIETPHGITSLALPADCVRSFTVGQSITLSVAGA
jgi:hypothetical protein